MRVFLEKGFRKRYTEEEVRQAEILRNNLMDSQANYNEIIVDISDGFSFYILRDTPWRRARVVGRTFCVKKNTITPLAARLGSPFYHVLGNDCGCMDVWLSMCIECKDDVGIVKIDGFLTDIDLVLSRDCQGLRSDVILTRIRVCHAAWEAGPPSYLHTFY